MADRIIDAMVSIGRSAKRSTRFTLDQGSYFLLYVMQQRTELRLTDLAAAAELDSSTVSRHLRQLEDSELVTCKPDPVDRRAKLFSLTPKGENLLEEARAERRALLSERLSTWTLPDVRALEQLMSRLAHEVSQSPRVNPQNSNDDKDSLTPNDNDNPQHRKEARG